MTKAEVTVLHAAAEMDIVAEKENETRYLLNGGNASSVKVGSDVYVNVNGKDSDNGVAVEKPVEEKGGYVKEKLGDGDDCLANGIAKQSASEAAVVIDSSVEQSDDKVDDLVNGVSTDDDATHKVSVNSISSNPIVSVGGMSFVVDVQSNQYSGNLADLEMASKLVGKSLDVVSGLKSETNVSSDSISVVESNPAEKTCGVTNGGIQFGSFDDKAERETPFNYMIRVPRNDDERLKVMIRLARNKVDEKIRIQRMLHIDMQSTWVTSEEYRNDFSDAAFQEQVARDLHRSKCQEIEWMQSVIDIEDIEVKIRNMEWTIQHQTLPLKDEKLSSTMSRQEENQQGLDRKERLKSLKKEADQLRANLINAVAITEVTRRKYYKESEKLSESLYLLKAADDNQEEAYAQLQSLKKQLYEKQIQLFVLQASSLGAEASVESCLNLAHNPNKNQHFRQYRDEFIKANELGWKGDKVALQNFCINQVEKFMDLWNNNDAFQKEYVRCNERSTLWRLRTLDGRSLGPGEVPPVIPQAVNGREVMDHTMSGLNLEGRTQEEVAVEKAVKVLAAKVVEQKKGGRREAGGNEEEESDRKAEELRKEEEAAKLKEQRRLEEIAKAKEALERKRRMAEKAEAREAKRAANEAVAKPSQNSRDLHISLMNVKIRNISRCLVENAKVVEQKKFMQSAPTESVSATASNGDKIEEAEEEKPKGTEEEDESDRKAEELSKEEEAAKLKEQRRLEEIAKAKEALERKRRKAEKAETREAKQAANEAVAKPP
ncbi:proton pump-interactor 1-like [Gossypium arboreum]|uniref:proton pump-interactor 1-like n=1 Tax=Gossypium arboreum TaxID=29729 RepID=UPI0022F160C8|nr:proton pump-interactor 1-like [Gossypium arboreum]